MTARDPWFDAQVYGQRGGVMFHFREQGESAQAVADAVAERHAGYPQAASVGVWACDGKSGTATARVPNSQSVPRP